MEPTLPRVTALRFGVFEVDREAGELRKNGLKVPLQEQPFRVLTLLLENAGKVVTREELQQTLWPADTFVEFDRGLNTAINKVREALGDSATSPRFVETVPRRGYRFLAPVEGLPGQRSSETAPASAPGFAHPGRKAWVAAIAGLLVLASVGLLLWRQFSQPAAVPNLPLRKLAIVPKGMSTGSEPFERPAISPDGRHIVAVLESGSPPKRALSLYSLENGQWQELPGTEGAAAPFWSPGSDFVGFFVAGDLNGNSAMGLYGDLKKVPIQGGPAIAVCGFPGSVAGSGTWSSNGDEIMFSYWDLSGRGGLYSVPSVGGSAKLLGPGGEAIHPLLLPAEEGKRALLSVGGHIQLLDSAGRQRRILPRDKGANLSYGSLVYSPTGHLIYERWLEGNSSDIWAVPFSLKTLTAAGGPFPIAHNAASPSVSRDGTLVYCALSTPRQRRLVWRDRTGKKVGEIGEPQLDMSLPAVSPDGRYVAVEGVESGTGIDIWIHDTQRPLKTRLTLDPAIDSRPYWSPDGKQILFWSNRTGNVVTTFIQDADGAGNAGLVAANPGAEWPTDWSPDGRFLLFDGGEGISYLGRALGGNWEKGLPPHTLIPGGTVAGAGKLSPDARFVAYVSWASGKREVYVQQFPEPGRKWQVSPGGGDQPRWSKRGNELFYVNGDTLFAVPVSTRPDFSAGAPTRLFSDANLVWKWPQPTYDVAPDGRRFVLIEPVGPVPQSAIWVVQNWFAEFRDRKPARR